MQKIKVYYFTKYDIIVGKNIRSKRPATLEAIAAVRGTAIEETVQEVDASRLDGNGFLPAEKNKRRPVSAAAPLATVASCKHAGYDYARGIIVL